MRCNIFLQDQNMLGWHGSLLKSFSSPLLKYLSYFTCSQEWFRAGLGIWVRLLYWYWLVFLHYNWPSEEVVLFCCVNSDNYTKDGVNCPLSLGHLETKIRAEHILLFRSWFWLVTTQFQLPLKKKETLFLSPEIMRNTLKVWWCLLEPVGSPEQ